MGHRNYIEKQTTKELKKRVPFLQNTDNKQVSELRKKYWITGTTNADFNESFTGAAANILNKIPQNVTQTGRLGRRAEMHYLDFFGYVFAKATTLVHQTLLMMIVYDNCPSVGTPSLANLLQNADDAVAPTVTDSLTPQNKFYEKRFEILAQRRISWPLVGAISGVAPDLQYATTVWTDPVNSSVYIKMRIPLKNLPVIWKGSATAASTDYYNGAVYAVFMGASAVDLVEISYTSKICYTG